MKIILLNAALAIASILLASLGRGEPTPNSPVKNIVLVHGAFLDGSGWEPVYNILVQKGYKVSVAQHTLQSLTTDLASVERVINQQDGPCILVGHSYGGVIISQAGNNNKVAGLVYIAAHAPEANEKRSELVKKFPPEYKSLIKGDDGYDYINPKDFPSDFAADLPVEKARFMANSQMPTADVCFQEIISHPAWKTKPSWYLVAKADKIISPALERFYAHRINAKKTLELEGASHSVYTSRPQEVAQLIEDATRGVLR